MIRTRLAVLEATRRKRAEHPSPVAVIVQLSDAEPDAATVAQVAQWAALPLRERRKIAPFGIRLVET